MEIGAKLQKARAKANLTQEQVAESLGVSRQTISNWENEKTYPDIRSVVLLSDLYEVSLDFLLKDKENITMSSNYINYLEESTNTVKSRNRLSELIISATYLLIWSCALVTFWFFTKDSDAMGYGLMCFWIILPVTNFVTSFMIGVNNYYKYYKWLYAVAMGVTYMLAEYATFSTANMVAFSKFNLPEWGMIIGGAVISALGLGIGYAIHLIKEKRQHKRDAN